MIYQMLQLKECTLILIVSRLLQFSELVRYILYEVEIDKVHLYKLWKITEKRPAMLKAFTACDV